MEKTINHPSTSSGRSLRLFLEPRRKPRRERRPPPSARLRHIAPRKPLEAAEVPTAPQAAFARTPRPLARTPDAMAGRHGRACEQPADVWTHKARTAGSGKEVRLGKHTPPTQRAPAPKESGRLPPRRPQTPGCAPGKPSVTRTPQKERGWMAGT